MVSRTAKNASGGGFFAPFAPLLLIFLRGARLKTDVMRNSGLNFVKNRQKIKNADAGALHLRYFLLK
jgi:hypothetical protein